MSASDTKMKHSSRGNGFRILCMLAAFATSTTSHADKIYFVHNDHLGTPQVITDENKNVVWEVDRDPWGNITNVIVDDLPNNVSLPGQYFDEETGLHYNWNRYMDPTTGRYITSDPIGLAGGINTYGYALQNPVMYVDFNGLVPGELFDSASAAGTDAISWMAATGYNASAPYVIDTNNGCEQWTYDALPFDLPPIEWPPINIIPSTPLIIIPEPKTPSPTDTPLNTAKEVIDIIKNKPKNYLRDKATDKLDDIAREQCATLGSGVGRNACVQCCVGMGYPVSQKGRDCVNLSCSY